MALNIGRLVGQARRYAAQNPDAVGSGLDRVGDIIDRRTGGKHAAHITKAKDAASRALGTTGGDRGRRSGTGGPDDLEGGAGGTGGRREDGPAPR